MAYVNFKEEKSVLKKQLDKRKNNNEKLYIDIIKHKENLSQYVPNLEFSYKKVINKLIGKKGIFESENFQEIINQDIICTRFIGCNFRNVTFKECRFVGYIFEECNLNGGGVIFENCTFLKEDSEKIPSLNIKDNLGCSFYNCEIYAKFLSCDISFTIFEKSKIKTTIFEMSYMNNTIIIYSELNMVEIIDCDLSGFKTLETYIVDISFNDKYKTKFDEKTFFDKIIPRVKDKQEYEGIYMTYETLADKFKENTLNNNFGEYYYLAKCTERECVEPVSKIGSYIYWLLCGYGERPWFCILSSLAIVIIFAFIYLIIGVEIDGNIISYSLNNISTWKLNLFIRDFNEAINLSIGMFAGVGVNNAKPTEISYIISNIEMLGGIVMMGLGIGTLTRKVIR
ncbi:pentapeptide repeat-containing protein [Romboutsia sedimentorum]|uniref:pentapeptide repeat-containing protein n=1 Tax=Romboutsia sedimentorum TaxID=1368474 RepID=UPI0024DE2FC1|nr:pentapeptide repeat-containing protein [Romboutsia sedimentorum]MDK2585165.1 pentapeptide repeat-containing protein [Romboutsia sedimentorum]